MFTRNRNISQESVPSLHFIRLPSILPDNVAISIHLAHLPGILSLVSVSAQAQNTNPILYETIVHERRLRPILVLLAFPKYCPYPVVRASSDCSFPDLLSGIFYPNSLVAGTWQNAIQYHTYRLEQARQTQQRKAIRQELRPVYALITEIRPVLKLFCIGVIRSPAGDGYQLVSYPQH